ncbi:hypothetical protein [Micromonospora sediminicola]|uniref:hypothetical protein n=1 Tax=Micromonospora sediminicola TaxID=946078 RepID=UPI0037A0B356
MRKLYRIAVHGFEDDTAACEVWLTEREAAAFGFVAELLNEGAGATTPTMTVEGVPA